MAKYDVVVYLSTLPRIKNHGVKVQILNDFAEGAKKCGAKVLITTDRQFYNTRLAVMIGWYGQKISGPHIQFRRELIDYQKNNGHHIMPIDGNCFKWADPDDIWLRYSLDSVYYDQGNYANHHPSKQKWRDVSKTLKIHCKDYTNSGNHILLCLQRDNGWQGKGFDQQHWVGSTINKIREHSDRPIVLRCHPGSISDTSAFNGLNGVTVSDCRQNSIIHDLSNAHAGVFYNSSSSVACALEGVPVFASESSAVTWDIANKDLANIENPQRPDRTEWLWKLADAHWSRAQSRQGLIYQKFEPLLSPA